MTIADVPRTARLPREHYQLRINEFVDEFDFADSRSRAKPRMIATRRPIPAGQCWEALLAAGVSYLWPRPSSRPPRGSST